MIFNSIQHLRIFQVHMATSKGQERSAYPYLGQDNLWPNFRPQIYIKILCQLSKYSYFFET